VDRQPNILFLMTDQQRGDALSCVSDWVDTPHLDRIADEGVRYSQAYTNSPVCVPARVSLMTGRYPHQTGVWANGPRMLDPEAHTWTQSVRDAGYVTSVFGKTHLHPHKGDLRDREHLLHTWGLDHVDEIGGPRTMTRVSCRLTDLWKDAGVLEAYRQDLESRYRDKPWVVRPSPVPFELYADVYVGTRARDYLRSYREQRPWMCWVSFSGPHEPWDTPPPYAGTFDPASMPEPLQEDRRARKDRANRPRGVLDQRNRVEFEPGDVAALRADYAARLKLIDDQVGELLRVVEERGELDNTVIALGSDHGEMNGDFGMIYTQNFLNPAVRIPFLLRVPGGRAGWVCEDPVELMDLGATLAELAGGDPVPGSRARSVADRVLGRTDTGRQSALSELSGEVMIASDGWKLAVNRRGQPYLLYDLDSDPDEQRNLAGVKKYADQTRRLQAEMLRRIVRSLS
jgi:choline-sulfatase